MTAYFNRPSVEISLDKIADAARALKQTTDEIASEIEQSGKVVLLDFSNVQARPENVDAFIAAMRAAGLHVARQESMVFAWGKKAEALFKPPLVYSAPFPCEPDPTLRRHEWLYAGRLPWTR